MPEVRVWALEGGVHAGEGGREVGAEEGVQVLRAADHDIRANWLR